MSSIRPGHVFVGARGHHHVSVMLQYLVLQPHSTIPYINMVSINACTDKNIQLTETVVDLVQLQIAFLGDLLLLGFGRLRVIEVYFEPFCEVLLRRFAQPRSGRPTGDDGHIGFCW